MCIRDSPGSVETWISLDVARVAEVPLLGLLARRCGMTPDGAVKVGPHLLRALLGWYQRRQAGQERRARWALLQADREWERGLSFGGSGE